MQEFDENLCQCTKLISNKFAIQPKIIIFSLKMLDKNELEKWYSY